MIDAAGVKRRIDARAPDGGSGRTTLLGRRVEYHEIIDSTNDRARALGVSGEPEGLVVVAGAQSRGRGRGSRSWHSGPGLGVYMSVLLRPIADPATIPIFALMAACAVVDALRGAAGPTLEISWPNDIVTRAVAPASPRKVAGILTEARTSRDGIGDLVVGVGVNVHHHAQDFPEDLRARSASLDQVAGRSIDRVDLIARIVHALETWYATWHEEGDRAILDGYRERAGGLEGRRVRVAEGARGWSGVTAGLSQDGALRVIRDPESGVDARIVEIRQGDVLRVEEAG